MTCIFCSIIAREIPTDFVYEDDTVVVFADIHPSAPVHCLIVPKRHVASVMDLATSDRELAASLIVAAKKVAEDKGLTGYKLIFNVGRDGGQAVDHLHLHLLGGWKSEKEREHFPV